MLIDAVIVVLQEVLEAALLLSMLLAISRWMRLSTNWVWLASILGVAGASVYAAYFNAIGELFDYRGQEVLNSIIQIAIYVSAILVLVISAKRDRLSQASRLLILVGMSSMVALAMTREFSEIVLYVGAFASNSAALPSVVIGGAVGAGIGASLGVVLYYAFTLPESSGAFMVCRLFLILVITGILMQAVPLLQQADFLSASAPVWDTSGIVAERSVLGELLFVIFGYEATPTFSHLVFYLAGLIFAGALFGLATYKEVNNVGS